MSLNEIYFLSHIHSWYSCFISWQMLNARFFEEGREKWPLDIYMVQSWIILLYTIIKCLRAKSLSLVSNKTTTYFSRLHLWLQTPFFSFSGNGSKETINGLRSPSNKVNWVKMKAWRSHIVLQEVNTKIWTLQSTIHLARIQLKDRSFLMRNYVKIF